MVRPFIIIHVPDSIRDRPYRRLLLTPNNTSINHYRTSEETLHLLFNTSRQAILLQGGIHSCGSDVQMIDTCVDIHVL